MPNKRIFFILALLCTSLLMSMKAVAEVNSVYISSRLDPNAIIITEVDVVFIYDQTIADSLPDSKSSWYSSKRQFSQNAGDKIDIVNVFIPQGFDSEMLSLPTRRAEAIKVVVFAQHDDSKASPRDITEMNNVAIEIDPFGIRVLRRE